MYNKGASAPDFYISRHIVIGCCYNIFFTLGSKVDVEESDAVHQPPRTTTTTPQNYIMPVCSLPTIFSTHAHTQVRQWMEKVFSSFSRTVAPLVCVSENVYIYLSERCESRFSLLLFSRVDSR